MELIIGNTLSMNGGSYQNYDLTAGSFLPFGFSGVVVNRNGDNTQASLAFPNNDLARSWASEAATANWIVTVGTINVGAGTTIYTYVGQVSSSFWDETKAVLQLSSVLDAVGADIPFRVIGETLLGAVPNSSAFRLS
ncbi:hypothetical protein EBT31_01020 [bacterium]|jgi:hypothetical protein|nr:hypothetical protein [bacterium]